MPFAENLDNTEEYKRKNCHHLEITIALLVYFFPVFLINVHLPIFSHLVEISLYTCLESCLFYFSLQHSS